MTIEQLKAMIAALSKTKEDEEANKAEIDSLQVMLEKALEDENDDDDEGNNSDDDDDDLTPEQQKELVDRELKKMKANMNKMADKLKATQAANAKREAEAKAAEITRLKEEGKLQEALEMELESTKGSLGNR